jgi:hypothetical protein
MMDFKYLRRTVTITHEHGNLQIRIAESKRWNGYTIRSLAVLTVFLFFVAEFVAPLRHMRWSMTTFYVSLFLAPFLATYLYVLWTFLWKAFGIEEVLVKDGVMRWSCKVLWFNDELDFPVNDISDVKAITPWHGRNRVEFTAQGRSYHLFKVILRDEATELAQALQHAVTAR